MAAGKCTAAYHTDEWHGYGCSITEGACMFLYPNSQACAEQFGEGPDCCYEENCSTCNYWNNSLQRCEHPEQSPEKHVGFRSPSNNVCDLWELND